MVEKYTCLVIEQSEFNELQIFLVASSLKINGAICFHQVSTATVHPAGSGICGQAKLFKYISSLLICVGVKKSENIRIIPRRHTSHPSGSA